MLPRYLAGLLAWTTIASCQGGSYGFTLSGLSACPNTLNGSQSVYYGCFNVGFENTTTSSAFAITNGSTFITPGSGANIMPFIIAESGKNSMPGYIINSSTWTSSVIPANCTVACRGHGFKYAMFTLGSCGCSTYVPSTISRFVNALGNEDFLYDAIQGACTSYTATNSFGLTNCQGDTFQRTCGWVSKTTYYGGLYPNGLIGVPFFFDTTFAADSTLSASTEATKYGYLGCFILASLTTSFQPQGFTNTFTVASDCYLFCARYNMPYAGMSYNGANSIQCTCGAEFSPGSYQYLPDSAKCAYDCSTGAQTCNVGGGCCGNGIYYTVYRNINLLGCYEPPIPGISLVGTATYPAACYSTPIPATTTVATKGAVNLTTTRYPFTTAPPQFDTGISTPSKNYAYLGCHYPNSIVLGVTNASWTNSAYFLNPPRCGLFCSTANTGGTPYNYFAVAGPPTAAGATCFCGNSLSNTLQLPFYNCSIVCRGPRATNNYLCGGGWYEQAVYGPPADVAGLSQTPSYATWASSWSCISTTAVTSTTLSSSSSSSSSSSIISSTIYTLSSSSSSSLKPSSSSYSSYSSVISTKVSSSSATSSSAVPTVSISTDGHCGLAYMETCQGSIYGNSCAANGTCGYSGDPAFSGPGCQPAYGSCLRTSTDGLCGLAAMETCTNSTFGESCAANGTCGPTTNPNFSAPPGCQTGFGSCLKVSTDGACGLAALEICQGSVYGNSCNSANQCGPTTNSSFSAPPGCQSAYGSCLKVSTDGACGFAALETCQGSAYGNSCNSANQCGPTTNSSFSAPPGCQSAYGSCLTVSTDGACGLAALETCQGSAYGNSCNSANLCGPTANSSFSAPPGCQSAYGTCLTVSTDGLCGLAALETCLGSAYGDSCSASGHCGPITNSSFSAPPGCQSTYGTCLTVSTDGICGSAAGETCQGSSYGNSCGPGNTCGPTSNSSFSAPPGCQSTYGTCLTVSIDGNCGLAALETCQGSAFGTSCAANNTCGSSSGYYGSGCQADFGQCLKISTDGLCGLSALETCQGSSYGQSCASNNTCVSDAQYYGPGCQPDFGTCPAAPSSISYFSSTFQASSSSLYASSSIIVASSIGSSSIATSNLASSSSSEISSFVPSSSVGQPSSQASSVDSSSVFQPSSQASSVDSSSAFQPSSPASSVDSTSAFQPSSQASSEDISTASQPSNQASTIDPSSTFAVSSAVQSTASAVPSGSISTDGVCGSNGKTCTGSGFGTSCSASNQCGSTPSFYGTGCQPLYGTCSTVSVDGNCGNGVTCTGSGLGTSCSANDTCGSTPAFYGTGCQPLYGNCSTVSVDGNCGNGVTCTGSTFGSSCSGSDTCGSSPPFYGTGCQPLYGNCSTISIDGGCGNGVTCTRSLYGPACSAAGECGSGSPYTDPGCQPLYGDCSTATSTASSSAVLPSPTTSAGDMYYEFWGCYNSGTDNSAYHQFTEYWNGGNQIDVNRCLQYCEAGAPRHAPPYTPALNIIYKYAILEFHGDVNADWCYCTNFFPIYIGGPEPNDKCNTLCADDPTEYCGGYNPDNSTWATYGGPNFANLYVLKANVTVSSSVASSTAFVQESSSVTGAVVSSTHMGMALSSTTADLIGASSSVPGAPPSSTYDNGLIGSSSAMAAVPYSSIENAAISSAVASQADLSSIIEFSADQSSPAASNPPAVASSSIDTQVQLSTSAVASTTAVNTNAQTTGESLPSATATGFGPVQSNVLLSVILGGHAKLKKRQGNTMYLAPDSSMATAQCSSSNTFTLSNGQLFSAANGEYVSTDPGTTWQPFLESPVMGSINTVFRVDANGYLSWDDASFTGGTALFCQMPSGQVNILFRGPTDVDVTYPVYPATCVEVSLRLYDATQCPASPTITSSSMASASGNFCPTFPASWSPTSAPNELCLPQTVSWQEGCTTLPNMFGWNMTTLM